MTVITYLTKTKSRKEGLVLARGSKDTVHSGREGRSEECDTVVTLDPHSGSREMRAVAQLIFSFSPFESRSPAHRTACAHGHGGSSCPVTSLWKTLTHAQRCISLVSLSPIKMTVKINNHKKVGWS